MGPSTPRRTPAESSLQSAPTAVGAEGSRGHGWSHPSSNCKPDRGIHEGAWSVPSAPRGAPSARSARPLTVAGLAATVALTAAWAPPSSTAALATGASIAILTIAALVDAVAHRLPNALVASRPPSPSWRPSHCTGPPTSCAVRLAGAALLGGPLLVTHLIAPRGMGFGDVKAGGRARRRPGPARRPAGPARPRPRPAAGGAVRVCRGASAPSPSARPSSPGRCSPSSSDVSPASTW